MTARESLSVVASRLSRLIEADAEGAELDAGFDAGEFSGPAHARRLPVRIARTLAEAGWTAGEFLAELEARTSAAWVWRMGWDVVVDEVGVA